MARSFADELTVDAGTGLPALPENYAWEVTRVGEKLYVSLKWRSEELLGFWDKLFGKKATVYWNEYIDGHRYWELVPLNFLNEEGILMAATAIYNEIHASATKVNELDAFVGLYPPKSIL